MGLASHRDSEYIYHSEGLGEVITDSLYFEIVRGHQRLFIRIHGCP